MGTGEVVHLVSNPDKAKQKSAAGRAADSAKQEAKGKVQEAKEQAHDTWQKMTAPGRMHRFKQFLVSQSPYRRNTWKPGTRFVADLDAPLDFGETTRTGGQLTAVGGAPLPDSTLKARLVAEVKPQRLPRAAPRSRPFLPSALFASAPVNSSCEQAAWSAEFCKRNPRTSCTTMENCGWSSSALKLPKRLFRRCLRCKRQAEHLQASSQAMIGNLEGLEGRS